MNKCQYCEDEIVMSNTLTGIKVDSIHNEKIKNQCCNNCMIFIKIAQLLFYSPYEYMITQDRKVYSIRKYLDINGKLVYIRFNDGKLVKDYSNRLIDMGTVPGKLHHIIVPNCTITANSNKKMKLPKFIGVRKQ